MSLIDGVEAVQAEKEDSAQGARYSKRRASTWVIEKSYSTAGKLAKESRKQ
jgi:hypothetical protein